MHEGVKFCHDGNNKYSITGKIVVESTGTILGYQTYISTSATTTGGKMKESHQANALNIINIRQAY